MSDGEIASGGMQPWHGLSSVVAAALEAVRRQADVRATAERFRSLVEQIPAATYVDSAVTGKPIYVSPQIEHLFSVPAVEWMDGDDGWGRRIHPDDRVHTTQTYDESVARGEPYNCEYRMTGTDGVERWVLDEAATVQTADGRRVVQGVMYDITRRKLAEQRYAEAEERYRVLVEQLPLAIYIDALDERATTIYNSPQNAEISGYTHDEWVADPDLFEKTLHPDDREWVMAGFERARVALAPFKAVYRIVRPDGSIVWLHDESVVVKPSERSPGYRQGYLLDITALKEAEERLSHLAYHDSLTGLPNRAMFQEHLEVALARAERSGRGVAVLYVDLDDFKLVNDSFGHSAGDELLVEMARRLRAATRDTDVVARQGGDEFLILVADLHVGGDAEELDIAERGRGVAQQLRDALAEPFQIADTEIYCSGSVGISLFPVDAADGESLLKHADIAMYRAKELGRDGHQVFEREGGDARRPALDGRPAAARDRARAVRALLPAAGRPEHHRDRGCGGADPLVRRRSRAGHAQPVHPAGRAHRPDRADLGVGHQRGLPAGRGLARDGSRPVRVGQPAAGLLAADRDAQRARHHRVVRALARPHDGRADRVGGDAESPRVRADHRRAARARPASGHRRLRHRPLVARPAASDAGHHAQDRPLVRVRPAGRPQRRRCSCRP